MSSHCNPNIVEDGLVFLYDVDDIQSYKGEPTTNVNTFTLSDSGTDGSGQSSVGTRTIITDNHVRIVDVASNTRQSHLITGLTASTTYTVSIRYKKLVGTPTFRFQIQDYSGSSYLRTIKFTNTSEIGIEDVEGWQLASWTFTLGSDANAVRIWYQDGADYTTYTHSFELKNPQLEAKSHATPYVDGTRSATQGLLDRTGNSTIDLSNASFDSNAKLTFDDTTGGMTEVPVAHSYLSSSTIEVVVNPNTLNDKDMVGGYRHNNGYSSPTIGSIYILYNRFYASVITAAEVYRQVSSNTISANQYYHVVLNKDTVDGQLELFVNGVSQGTVSFDASTYGQWTTAGNYIGTNTLDIGVSTNTNSSQGWGSSTLDGQIPIFKVYSRTLTAAEVLQNYKSIKSRFNL